MAGALSEWEVDITYWEGDDLDHDNQPHERKATYEEHCLQSAVAPDGREWVCTRPADPPHRRHVAHIGRSYRSHEETHDGDCVLMAWTGPINEV